MAATRRVVEHLVFFQVKPDTPADRVAAFLANLNALRSLPGVLYLSAGPALPAAPAVPAGATSASPPASPWTHALIGRYESRDALQAYAVSPAHVAVVTENVKPIISDIAAVDWETDVPAFDASPDASSPPAHAAVHTAMIQWLESASPDAIAAAVAELRSKLTAASVGSSGSAPSAPAGPAGSAGCAEAESPVSVGENFSPARAKSFAWGLAVYARDEAMGGKLWEQEACRAVLELAERIDCVHMPGTCSASS
ncbi:hypothetical protein CLOP_g10311 [Closterium sp. NIES-67]|nr:hypothetical protein CLOP_g10311 [Closterium sp. NIES-67]